MLTGVLLLRLLIKVGWYDQQADARSVHIARTLMFIQLALVLLAVWHACRN
jgi:fumarate reductase subunit D